MYLPVCTIWLSLLGIIYLDAFEVTHASSHSLDIDILRFTPDTQTLLLVPPNQYVIHGLYPKIICIIPF